MSFFSFFFLLMTICLYIWRPPLFRARTPKPMIKSSTNNNFSQSSPSWHGGLFWIMNYWRQPAKVVQLTKMSATEDTSECGQSTQARLWRTAFTSVSTLASGKAQNQNSFKAGQWGWKTHNNILTLFRSLPWQRFPPHAGLLNSVNLRRVWI